ncbi:CopD family protein [Pigmentiphaga litoralis]|uniref:CopD family protein n=1 Tax=Pigmentiphaga litoralis TaxID=516702 RepID=UPI003B437677
MVGIKALHIAALVIWCGGLFYLPGMFMLHPRASDRADFHRLRMLTRFTFAFIVSPAAVIAIISGTALVHYRHASGEWLMWKLLFVCLMVFFHLYCGGLVARLGRERNAHGRSWSAALLAVPSLLIPLVLWMVLGKPTLLSGILPFVAAP